MTWHIPERGVKTQAHSNSKRWAPLSITDPLRVKASKAVSGHYLLHLFLKAQRVAKVIVAQGSQGSSRQKSRGKGSWWIFSPGAQGWESHLPLHPQRTPSSLDFPSHVGNPHSHHSPRSHRGCRTCILCTATCRSWQPRSCSGWTAGRWGDLEEAEMAALRPGVLTCHPLNTTLCLTWREGGVACVGIKRIKNQEKQTGGLDGALPALFTTTHSYSRSMPKERSEE